MTLECKLEALGLWTLTSCQYRRQAGVKEKEAKAEKLHSAPTFTRKPGQTLPEAELSRDVGLHQSGESLFLCSPLE